MPDQEQKVEHAPRSPLTNEQLEQAVQLAMADDLNEIFMSSEDSAGVWGEVAHRFEASFCGQRAKVAEAQKAAVNGQDRAEEAEKKQRWIFEMYQDVLQRERELRERLNARLEDVTSLKPDGWQEQARWLHSALHSTQPESHS